MTKGPQRLLIAIAVALSIGLSACSSTPEPAAGAATASSGSFPVTLHAANGVVRITHQPHAIVSLSPTATEMLYAIGAGSQVKAVDQYSDYPPQAPKTKLDGYQPNVEAIVSYRPDLVVVAGDSTGLTRRLATFGIPVLSDPAAATLNDAYAQVRALGVATGHVAQADAVAAGMVSQIAAIVRATPRPAAPATYYYELEPTYYSVTSSTFIGRLLGLLGLKDIADAASGASASGGYPQLASEYIVHANPSYIFLADTVCCGQNARTVAARPGWSTVRAVRAGDVVGINDDIASRWGPRVVDLLRVVATALDKHRGSS